VGGSLAFAFKARKKIGDYLQLSTKQPYRPSAARRGDARTRPRFKKAFHKAAQFVDTTNPLAKRIPPAADFPSPQIKTVFTRNAVPGSGSGRVRYFVIPSRKNLRFVLEGPTGLAARISPHTGGGSETARICPREESAKPSPKISCARKRQIDLSAWKLVESQFPTNAPHRTDHTLNWQTDCTRSIRKKRRLPRDSADHLRFARIDVQVLGRRGLPNYPHLTVKESRRSFTRKTGRAEFAEEPLFHESGVYALFLALAICVLVFLLFCACVRNPLEACRGAD